MVGLPDGITMKSLAYYGSKMCRDIIAAEQQIHVLINRYVCLSAFRGLARIQTMQHWTAERSSTLAKNRVVKRFALEGWVPYIVEKAQCCKVVIPSFLAYPVTIIAKP